MTDQIVANTMGSLLTEAPNINPSVAILGHIRRLRTDCNLSVMDAAVHYSETSGIDIEYIGELIREDALLLSALTEEAEALHCLPKKNRLDFDE